MIIEWTQNDHFIDPCAVILTSQTDVREKADNDNDHDRTLFCRKFQHFSRILVQITTILLKITTILV